MLYLQPLADELLEHPCLQVLEKEIDVKHTCGYVNLLRTGAPPQQQTGSYDRGQSSKRKQPTAEDQAKQSEISDFLEDLKELGIDEPKVAPTVTTPPPSTQEQTPSEGQNGTETASGSHSDDSTGKEKDGGTSETGGCVVYSEESMTPSQKKLFEEWLPLELSFGIPLFSDDANRTVCDKVHH